MRKVARKTDTYHEQRRAAVPFTKTAIRNARKSMQRMGFRDTSFPAVIEWLTR